MDSNHRSPAYETGAFGRFATPRKKWCPLLGLNQRPLDYRSSALPAELSGQSEIGRDDTIRTFDFLLPKQVLYQAELSPVLRIATFVLEMRTEGVGALGQIRTDVELSLTGVADQRLQPLGHECKENDGAESRTRTDDVLLTMQLLCLLSYLGENWLRRMPH